MSKTVLQRFTRMAMLLAVLLLPLSLHAQNMTLQLKDVTVQEAVTRLQSQGNYTIVVNSEVVDLQKRITVSAKDQPLDKVLAQIFAGQNVEFVINGNSVSVNRKSAQPASQETSFHGFVTDRNGEPLIGASVFEKKSGKYALTDEKGAFFMDGIRFPATFTVSYLGFDDQEVTLTGRERQPYTIVMTSENTVLDELVVVGYGTQKRVNLTGAVSVIDGTTLNQRPVTNTAMALQGADPSIVLTNGNGSIEANEYSLSVRGKVSLNSGSPLVLVDGVEGSLSLVNPNDIESISVLKDASACAIYGAKASAGVILVNTKSGEDFGRIVKLVPVERGTSGRLVRLKIVGTKKTMIIGKELEIRRLLSTSHLKSSAFTVETKNVRGGVPQRKAAAGYSRLNGYPRCLLAGENRRHGIGRWRYEE